MVVWTSLTVTVENKEFESRLFNARLGLHLPSGNPEEHGKLTPFGNNSASPWGVDVRRVVQGKEEI